LLKIEKSDRRQQITFNAFMMKNTALETMILYTEFVKSLICQNHRVIFKNNHFKFSFWTFGLCLLHRNPFGVGARVNIIE